MGVSLPGLSAFREKIEGLVDRRVKAVGAAIAARARELAPVDTGALRRSIYSDPDAGVGRVRIVAGMPYAYWVEVGTSRTRAQPFLRPALAEAPRLWRALGDTEISFPNVPEPYEATPGRQAGYGRTQVRYRGSIVRQSVLGAPRGRVTP